MAILVHIKYYGLYAIAGMFMVNWWDHINPLQFDLLAEDFVRGVSFPLHMAYMNVQNIYGNDFHILDLQQNTLFYFWLIPGLTFSTHYPFSILV